MYQQEWLKYSPEQRQTLAAHFNLKKTKSVEVFNNTLVCDGHDDKEIYKIDKAEADKLLGLNKNEKDEKPIEKKTSDEGGNKGKGKGDKKA